jgi:two-component system KDP operon response regulator KdpE
MTHVLVVDDERQIRRALNLNLVARGYEVTEASTGEAALGAIAADHPDLVLLDLGLPGLDGVAVIEAVRGWSAVPIIVLTAREDERSKVQALDLGADDYVTKPFGMAELIARIGAALRRSSATDKQQALVRTRQFELDLVARRAFVFARPDSDTPSTARDEVRLTRTEWLIVAYLVNHPHQLITYKQLITAVWGRAYDPDQNVLRVHMGHVRRKLERAAAKPEYFITDVGVGYRFEPGAG